MVIWNAILKLNTCFCQLLYICYISLLFTYAQIGMLIKHLKVHLGPQHVKSVENRQKTGCSGFQIECFTLNFVLRLQLTFMYQV